MNNSNERGRKGVGWMLVVQAAVIGRRSRIDRGPSVARRGLRFQSLASEVGGPVDHEPAVGAGRLLRVPVPFPLPRPARSPPPVSSPVLASRYAAGGNGGRVDLSPDFTWQESFPASFPNSQSFSNRSDFILWNSSSVKIPASLRSANFLI